MNYIVFEDSRWKHLKPFSLNHASFEMRCGIYSNLERVHRLLSSTDKLYLIVRKELEDLIRVRFPQLIINPKIIPSGLMLNGATIWNQNLIEKFESDKSYSCNGSLIAINTIKSIELEQFQSFLDKSIQVTLDINVIHINYIWDLIYNISDIIKNDLVYANDFVPFEDVSHNSSIAPSVIMNNKSNIFSIVSDLKTA